MSIGGVKCRIPLSDPRPAPHVPSPLLRAEISPLQVGAPDPDGPQGISKQLWA